MSGFFLAPRLAFGPGALEQLSGLAARRALVVVDPALAGRPAPRRVVEELGKSDTVVEVVDDLAAPDALEGVARVAERARGHGADWIVAIGGGRLLDGAKAARFALDRPDVDWGSLTPVAESPERPTCRLAALPTTSGSGAEATPVVDLVRADGTPIELAHRALLPDWALVDPSLATGRPAEAVVDGGFEVLGLAIEAYLSAWSNPFSDALALDAALTVLGRLAHAIRWSEDPEAPAALQAAATAAGLAAGNAQRGLAHALARALVRPTGLPYGRLVGIALPYVLDFDQTGARERLELLAARAREPEERTELSLAARVRRLGDHVRLPPTVLAAHGDADRVERELDRVVAECRRSPAVLGNPRVPTEEDVRGLVGRLLGRAEPPRP
jgi:alcohol dehydrogenase class IV